MPPQSLILADAQQPALFSSAEMEERIFAESEKKGEFTADRLFKRRPDIYKAIVRLLGEMRGQIYIGELLTVSPSTVRAVARREGIPIGIEKERLANQAFDCAHLAFEAIHDDLSDPERRKRISTKDKAIIAEKATDKALLLAGEATQRIEVAAVPAPEHEDFNAYLDRLKSAAGMGLAGEKTAAYTDVPSEAVLATHGEPNAVQSETVAGTGTDVESSGKSAEVTGGQ